MKKVLIYFCLAGIFLLLTLIPQQKTPEKNPQPTVIIAEKNDPEFLRKKAEWYERMHLAAPGVDWRQIDNNSRAVLRSQRSEKRHLKSGDSELFADGELVGRWNEKGANNVAGRMHNMEIDFANNVIYGASDGGQIWKGGMNGENWVSLTENYHVKGVHFLRIFKNANETNRIIQASPDSLLMYSDSEGRDWTISTGLQTMVNDRLTRAVSNANEEVFLHFLRSNRTSYVFKSDDHGTNFISLGSQESSPISDIWTSRYETCPVYILIVNDLYLINENNQIELVGPVGVNFSTSEIERCQLNGMVKDGVVHLAIMYRLGKSTRFVTSDDGGKSWSVKGDVHEGPFMSNSFGMSSIDPLVMGFGGVNSYRSFDGGASWTLINSWGEYYGDIVNKLHADIPEIEFFKKPDGTELVVVSTDGGSYISTDKLQSVKNISLNGLRTAQYYSTYTHRENNSIIYAGSQDQGFQKTTQQTEGIASFQQTISGDYGHIVSSDGGRSLWTVYPGFVMRYSDAAASNDAAFWNFVGEEHFWMPPLLADPYFPERVYLAGGTTTTGAHLWYLEHKSTGISAVEMQYDFSGGTGGWISSMAFSPINKDYRYVLNSRGKLYFSTDRGVNWTQSRTYGPGSHYFYGNSIIPDPKDINTIYIGGSGYSGYPVWVSTDGGGSFKGIGSGIPRTLVFEMAINETGTLLFAATEVGPFVYVVNQRKWYDLAGASAPDQTYWSVDYIPSLQTARFGTYGRGIWDFKVEHLGKSVTGAAQELPWAAGIGLEIYPNPVDESAQLNFNLNVGAAVQISLLDSSGKLVRTLNQGQLEPGSHQLTLSIGDVPAGLYFLRIQAGNQLRVEKLIKR